MLLSWELPGCISNNKLNNKHMKVFDKARVFEYSSLVMGSKDVPMTTYAAKRPKALTSTKTFNKKTDLLNAKFSKIKSVKARTKNERPDIFLEGEQLAKNTQAWQQELDIRYFEHVREKMRKSTPNAFLKHHPPVRRTPMPRSTPTC
jgi:hypothetical protein